MTTNKKVARAWQQSSSGHKKQALSLIYRGSCGTRELHYLVRDYAFNLRITKATTVMLEADGRLYEAQVDTTKSGHISVTHLVPAAEVRITTTRKAEPVSTTMLSEALGRLGACWAAIRFIESCGSLKEAWNKCENANWLLFLWSMIAAYDSDDVYLSELSDWVNHSKYTRHYFKRGAYRDFVEGLAYGTFHSWNDILTYDMHDCTFGTPSKNAAEDFKRAFRAPSQKDLRIIMERYYEEVACDNS